MLVNSLPKTHRRRVESVSSGETSYSRQHGSNSPSPITPTFSHVSVYRAAKLELHIYSPSLKSNRNSGDDCGPIAVFGERDRVGGKVFLDRECHSSGRLTISIEGAFTYPTPQVEDVDFVPEPSLPLPPRKHVFFASSTVIPISPGGSSPRTTFRDVVRRRPSAPVLHVNTSSTERSFIFGFDLPVSSRPGEELPPSFSASKGSSSSSGALFDVTYKIKAVWEPDSYSEFPSILEVPVLYQPERDFLSADGTRTPESWLEMPLRSDRPIPFRSAVTLPTSVTFSRGSSIPYFAVFTTTPRSPSLAKEIAADAAISVSLIRQVTVTEATVLPPTPPMTPSSANEDSDLPRHQKLLRRVARSGSHLRTSSKATDEVAYLDKPLPQLPTRTVFSESKTLQTGLSIGFPKKPKVAVFDERGHPSLESQQSLPDGLLRSKIVLAKDMLPNIDWAGLKVKYYLEVTVSLGQDDLRARIPIRIV